ncbi:MAG: hypothetical protein P8016_08325, partial [Sedimentisphaerales bacterium]
VVAVAAVMLTGERRAPVAKARKEKAPKVKKEKLKKPKKQNRLGLLLYMDARRKQFIPHIVPPAKNLQHTFRIGFLTRTYVLSFADSR